MISRKEFMKKYISIIIFSILSFFVFGFKVSALDVDINFDNHEHFNFFYEMKEDTPFYRWLIGQGENLVDTLFDYHIPYSNGAFNEKPFISVYYCSDLNSITIDSNCYYAIRLLSARSNRDPVVSSFYDDGNFYPKVSNGSTAYLKSTYYFFDSNGNYLSYIQSESYDVNYNLSYLNVNNFEYVLSMFYYYYSDVVYSSITTPSIKVNKVVVDNEEYVLSANNWLSYTWKKITSFFTGAKVMLDTGYGLEYFTKNYVITDSKGFPGLIKTLSGVDNDITIPSNYQSKSFSLTDELHLYPLGSCSLNDIALYVKANSELEDFTIYLNEVNSSDEMTYRSSYSAIYTPKINKFIKFNPLKVVDIQNVSTEISSSDFIKYVYRLSRLSNFGIYTVYYNPNCYSSVYVEESIEWTNPQSGNTITVSPEYNNWTDPENISAGNSIEFLSDPVNADNLLQKGWSNANSFVEAAGTIVSLSFTLFTDMPAEMQALLITFFSIGLILILLKIFL